MSSVQPVRPWQSAQARPGHVRPDPVRPRPPAGHPSGSADGPARRAPGRFRTGGLRTPGLRAGSLRAAGLRTRVLGAGGPRTDGVPAGRTGRAVRFAVPAAALALLLCGVAILELVERQTGRPGLLVGLGLAVLPVPLVLGALAWLDRVEPTPVRALAFCFGWGACAATLVAILANTWTADLLASHRGARGETIGSAVAAPLVEETCKGAAVLLLFLLRRRYVGSVAGGIVLAGVTACGFAFTENVLYLGRSWTEDRAAGHGIDATVCTFVLRGVLSPFAHPLFTALIGIGFGTAALARDRLLRTAAPAGGWLAATVLHGTWNAAAALGTGGFLLVYGVFMVPVFGGVIGLAVRARGAGLRAARLQLPAYVRAGWLGEDEPEALGTVRLRGRARRRARALHGPAGARAVDEYVALATALALLRHRAERGAVPVAEFAVREYGLLQRLWRLRPLASPALAEAAAEERADGG